MSVPTFLEMYVLNVTTVNPQHWPCTSPNFFTHAIAEELLIIFETEAKQWASYLQSVLSSSVSETAICCYDITTVNSRQHDLLKLSSYRCKLLILSRGLLEDPCQMQLFFLSHVLRPESCVVVLLCGVESLEPLLKLVPLNGDECLQISSEQDPQDYRSAVLEIICRGEWEKSGWVEIWKSLIKRLIFSGK